MAAQSPAAPEAPAAKKSKLPLILAILGLVVGLAGAGGGFYAWKSAQKHEAASEEDDAPAAKKASGKADKKGEKAKKAAKERKPAVYVPMEVFTVNLQGPGRDHYLQLGLVVEATDTGSADALKANMPVVRSQVLLLLASKTAEELAKPAGKDKLAEEVLERVRQPLEGVPALEGLERVHFSNFIIQ